MEQNSINVFVDGEARSYPAGTTYRTIAEEYQNGYEHSIVLAKVDHYLRELNKEIEWPNCHISFVTTGDNSGNLAYRRSVSFLATKAIYDVVGAENVKKLVIDFSVSGGYFIDLGENGDDTAIDETMTNQIYARMRELVDLALPIEKRTVSLMSAMQIFREQKMYDKERLLRYRRTSKVNLYSLDGFDDYYYGYLVPDTSYLKYFELHRYGSGIVVSMPDEKNPKINVEFKPSKKLYQTQIDTSKWLAQMGVSTVGALNDTIAKGDITELILAQEAMMEKTLGNIAERIASDTSKKFVMIAGPSSSGKTTFSHRLSVQLRAHNRIPHPIGVDNYYVDREFCPKDENGEYDFECLQAIDVKQFNRDMSDLLAGKEVELPYFNFKTGKREYKGNRLKLGENDVLVIEGIHCLNDALSYSLPKESKFKIYISALTQLNIDEHNRIPTTDVRLLRRMVRDARTRGSSAQETLQMWASVRKGEENNIFPFQEQADVMFNSALVYELAVLKIYAEPLLFGILPKEPVYDEAQRLLKFLDYFLAIDSSMIPINSLLREFVGGGCFEL